MTMTTRRRAGAFGSAVATLLLFAAAVPSPAAADTMRTLNLALGCETGLPYGLAVNNGSGWGYPSGSSFASGTTKYFTVSIPAGASMIAIDTVYCDGEPSAYYNVNWSGSFAGLNPGTSTVNATGYCEFDDYYGGLSRECNISVNSYS
ncbi:MAG TPA: hypothetical protein VFU73_02485 [Actinocrinis sp.]|nr:hypothetical protein [Actinocrinis sp.]